MSAQKRSAPSDQVRSRTSLKLDLLNAASVDDRLTAGNFRHFARVMQQVDMATWTATLSDDRVCAEVPGCKSRHTCNDHRKAIRDAGYFDFDAGSGRHPTRYLIAEAIPQAATVQIAAKRRAYELAKQAERSNRDVVRRPRKASSRRGEQPSDTVVPTPPVHLLSPYQESRRLQDETPGAHARERLTCRCGQPAVRMIRQRPTVERPTGTRWEFECQKCVDEDDRIPAPEHEFWELRMVGSRPLRIETTEEAYRRARDGC